MRMLAVVLLVVGVLMIVAALRGRSSELLGAFEIQKAGKRMAAK